MARHARIPITAAREIAEKYGYSQVIIFARDVTDIDENAGTCTVLSEHMTTYGKSMLECKIAEMTGRSLQKFMGWKETDK